MNRTDRSIFASWWWTVDRTLVAASLILLVGGLVLSFAASPAVAERIGASDSFYFVKRHAVFFVMALPILFTVSFFSPRMVRRSALVVFAGAIVLLVAVLFFGQEVKGARRWITLLGFSIQPSEFVKPAFIILSAWLFAEQQRRHDLPGNILAILGFIGVEALLIAQPDIGQTILTGAAWGAVFFVAGMPMWWILGLGGIGVGGGWAAYTFVPHVHARINRFLAHDAGRGHGGPMTADGYQAQQAHDSFLNGGWFGRGPGEGTVKRLLPDSHTDYIFAVVGEEFGLLVCALLAGIFGWIVFRGLSHATREEDPFIRYAIVGLVVLVGVQSGINMAVNLQLMPAKGMTLPFISYGGSSLLAIAFEMGCLIALTRRRPQATRFSAPIQIEPAGEPAPAE
ncbi:putative lipid II flippase FtsW [Siculibacillus lacustris]|uniref:Probable peptidoglycan glycosyltransferase FtsW n=1 Tax=Siculibacillus lacustris TaxID=1549641 RepID=A0A4V2KTU3_9HYPH|nr:putative lipid II flippase FtsW [Siculibacillus lacustris]TBW38710.1 putative lipid II flippase FtsW [Siculibacillus lacustris]